MQPIFIRTLLAMAVGWGAAGPSAALELAFPAPAELTAERREAAGSVRLPIGRFAAGVLPTRLAEGALSFRAFRMVSSTATTLQILHALQAQIAAAGYSEVFSCETLACGGYDFRYGMTVLPEPDMHVNLGDFRYVLAESPTGAVVALMISRSGSTGFVQITQLGDGAISGPPITANPPAKSAAAAEAPAAEPLAQTSAADGLIAGLLAGRAMVLEDLVFASGSSTLAEGDYGSLAELADWLRADPTRKVVLVGHTDASGSLDGNIKLSRLRAESVRQTLLYTQKILPDQVQAEGIGPLSPRVSNLTEAGRQKNRRVEVMVTSTDLLAP